LGCVFLKLTVFCGSRFGNKESYKFIAQTLGKYMAQEEIELVYGGSESGIMGVFSQTLLENNGKVTGIYPTGLFDSELPNTNVTTFIPTETIDERKVLLFEQGDAVLIFPGGLGTLEDYEGLKTLLETFAKEEFMDAKWLDYVFFSNNPLELVDLLRAEVSETQLLLEEAN